jgi:hypothetical protein
VANPIPFYRNVLRTLKKTGPPFLIGGGYAMRHHTRIRRVAKDLDVMIQRRDWPAAARALRAAGIYARLPFPHWLGKAVNGSAQVDIIFSSGNALVSVEPDWFDRAARGHVLGSDVLICPPEELLWSKSFVMERERFDGADVNHLILKAGPGFDWTHLCERYLGHERVLLAHLLLFGYVYPTEADIVPAWVLRHLAVASAAGAPGDAKLCRGTLLSRAQYLVDIEQWGFVDARLPPFGRITRRENTIWTNAIKEHWSRKRTSTGGKRTEDLELRT